MPSTQIDGADDALVHLTVRVRRKGVRRIDAIAAAGDETRTAVVRRLLVLGIAEHDRQQSAIKRRR